MGSSWQEIVADINEQRIEKFDHRIGQETHDLAVAGFNYAQSISPIGDDAHGGDFQKYWSVRDYAPRHAGDLPMSQIRNDDPGAVSIEYGTHDTPPHHTLTSTKVFIDSISAKDIHL